MNDLAETILTKMTWKQKVFIYEDYPRIPPPIIEDTSTHTTIVYVRRIQRNASGTYSVEDSNVRLMYSEYEWIANLSTDQWRTIAIFSKLRPALKCLRHTRIRNGYRIETSNESIEGHITLCKLESKEDVQEVVDSLL